MVNGYSRWIAAAVILAAAACSPVPDANRARPNILLVTIDTWRVDRLSASVTPNIDRLAAAGIRFTAARTAAPLTLPSHTTILTGLLPPAHGVRENGVDALSETHPTVAKLLRNAGYRTAAFVGAYVLDRRFGLAQGFDEYDDRITRDPTATERLEAERPAAAVVDAAIAWLDGAHRAPAPAPSTQHPAPAPSTQHPAPHPAPATQHPAPFFVWLHLYDPHAPYAPPPEFRGRHASAYDDEVSYADTQIARVFEWIHGRGLADDTLAIVAGDHGEGLGDHGERTHGMLVYDSTLRVPLVFSSPAALSSRLPGAKPAVREEAVSLADIAPTILRAAGIAPPSGMNGRDLLVPPATGGNDAARDLYSETEYPRTAGWSPLQALTDGRWKTIRAGSHREVYDIAADPREEHTLEQPSIANAMSARIDALRASAAPSSGERVISPEAAERLRALGYVAASTPSTSRGNEPNPATLIGAWNRFEDALTALNAKRPDAASRLEALAREYPESSVFQTTAARALNDAGHTGEALSSYRRAARRWPTDATLLHDLAVAARDAAGRATGAEASALRDEAEQAERAAIALSPASPGSALSHNGLGLMAIDAGRAPEAASEFERAATLDPNNAAYATNLGNAWRAIGDRGGAEQAYRRALAIDSGSADAANGLGVLLVEANRPNEAIAWFERALAAAPGSVEARLNLGIAQQQSGDLGRAAQTYRLVLATRGASKEKEAAARLLAALGAAR
jgi:arylsulfatase A-like enzyme/Flp pilus assembly protein TadD